MLLILVHREAPVSLTMFKEFLESAADQIVGLTISPPPTVWPTIGPPSLVVGLSRCRSLCLIGFAKHGQAPPSGRFGSQARKIRSFAPPVSGRDELDRSYSRLSSAWPPHRPLQALQLPTPGLGSWCKARRSHLGVD